MSDQSVNIISLLYSPCGAGKREKNPWKTAIIIRPPVSLHFQKAAVPNLFSPKYQVSSQVFTSRRTGSSQRSLIKPWR